MACIYGIEQNCNECRMCQKADKPRRTNADWIRGMNNAELAEFLTKQFCHGIGEELIKEWLEKEREG